VKAKGPLLLTEKPLITQILSDRAAGARVGRQSLKSKERRRAGNMQLGFHRGSITRANRNSRIALGLGTISKNKSQLPFYYEMIGLEYAGFILIISCRLKRPKTLDFTSLC
jgi:hypothetical protein